jgi:hypothetical protein
MKTKIMIFYIFFLFSFFCIRGEDFNWAVEQFNQNEYMDQKVINVIWGNNEFLAADGYESLYQSNTGKNWADVDYVAGGYIIDHIKWLDINYISVSNGIQLSPDGVNWSGLVASEQDCGSYLLDITWGNNVYIAVGEEGLAMKSSDGNTWDCIFTDLPGELSKIIYSDGNYYVLAGGSDRFSEFVNKSSDGIHWSVINLPYDDCTLRHDKTGIVSGSKGLVLSGNPESFYSADGENWQKIEPPLSMDQVTFCAGSNKYFGAKSGGGWFDAPKVFFSDDGKNWEEHWIGNWGYVAEKYFDVYSVACNEDTYVVGGTCTDNRFLGWADYYSCIMYSP